EGHEVAVHAWDHRTWQDRLDRMDEAAIRREFERAFAAFESALGVRPRASGAAAWTVTPRSLRIQDELGLDYASDLRGGPVCRLRAEGETLRTPQLPTTGRCIEELLTQGLRTPAELEAALHVDLAGANPAVLAVHAEVEGGPFGPVLEGLLDRLRAEGSVVRTLAEAA